MNINPDEVKLAKDVLQQGEVVRGTCEQRRIGPGGAAVNPTTVIVTDNRIIIINKATLGFRKDYEVIPYSKITSVRFEKGLISSSVFVRVEGYDKDVGLLKGGKEEGEIDGLRNKDAEELSEFLNGKIGDSQQKPTNQGGYIDTNAPGYVFCSKCGAKNSSSSAFCTKCGAKLTN